MIVEGPINEQNDSVVKCHSVAVWTRTLRSAVVAE